MDQNKAAEAEKTDDAEWCLGFDDEDLRLADEARLAMLAADRKNDAAVQTIGKVLGVKDPKILRE